MTSPSESQPRAAVVGTGLIGASIGLRLCQQGWWVAGIDHDDARAFDALERGAVTSVGVPHEPVDITFIATPVGTVAAMAVQALEWSRVVTDVGSVKAPIVAAVGAARFVGGHPMAGSEQEGIAGADETLFEGAVWVLTPAAETDPESYSFVRNVVSSLGAEVIAVGPEAHDELVAVVSHVPHLTAVTLMALAAQRSDEHRALLRLAAGGFRDMTRIAAGHPGIWPDICTANSFAIGETLDRLIHALGEVREQVVSGNREALLSRLQDARQARLNLPRPSDSAEELAVVRIPVPDRPGVLADVTTLATDLDVNIADLEIAHSAEGTAGVLILMVDARHTERLVGGLLARGYRASVRTLA